MRAVELRRAGRRCPVVAAGEEDGRRELLLVAGDDERRPRRIAGIASAGVIWTGLVEDDDVEVGSSAGSSWLTTSGLIAQQGLSAIRARAGRPGTAGAPAGAALAGGLGCDDVRLLGRRHRGSGESCSAHGPANPRTGVASMWRRSAARNSATVRRAAAPSNAPITDQSDGSTTVRGSTTASTCRRRRPRRLPGPRRRAALDSAIQAAATPVKPRTVRRAWQVAQVRHAGRG